MPGFFREHSWPFILSVALHGLLAAALLVATLISVNKSLPKLTPIPVDAVVVDSQVLHAAQRALTDRAAQEAARVRAAADAKAATEVAAAQATADAQMAAEKQRAAEEAKSAAAEVERTRQAEAAKATEAQKVAAAKRAEDAKRVEDAKRAEDARRAEDAKHTAEAKQADDAKHAADLKAKAEREAELKRQLADEEHVSAVEASPARAQYIARLAARIQNAWIKPPSARAGLDCVVNITQIPGGEVTSAHVSQCNGDAAARQSIENAVYRASPLPAPPDPALFERNLVIHFHPDE
ncbi:MAG TPA: TonB C-terminal domain-containing protein [Steroidobacteraceae bacterium]|nr:TonB C-terminal domain-containing protein [Steroidobacteraceae bacterium]